MSQSHRWIDALFASLLALLFVAQAPAPPDAPEPPLPEPDPTSDALSPAATTTPESDEAPAPPAEVELSPLVRRLLDDPITTDAERRRLRLFHGQWHELQLDALSPAERAQLALLRFDLASPALHPPDAPPLVAAEAALFRGEPDRAIELLDGDASAQAALLRGRALEQLGRLADAVETLRPWRDRLRNDDFTDAAELTAAAEAVTLLARLEGRPAGDYQAALDALARVRQSLDPLYWPAYLAEARLLVEKDSRQQGGEALLEALTLCPTAGEVWYELGLLAVQGFDFDRASFAVGKLRGINPTHALADLLDARAMLQQRDIDAARAIIEPALALYPEHREWLALLAAAEALAYDEAQTRATLDHLDTLSPGSPLGYFTVGTTLSAARQYAQGAEALREAIRRQPNDPAAWTELGLLLMQWGDLEQARDALAQAARLDPFNRRVGNQLRLADDLLGYETIETEHFVIRYKPGVDEALARDMPPVLEQIHRDITGVFQHVPPNKTQIDIMPDERYFGVRITGMPEIWTIAAATGDVLALTPPREGRHQRGPYNWANVIRHEFVHTVTLSQTRNRIPHWFTEACAVSQETTGRTYQTCQLLAWAVHEKKLFELDKINWGFIRPQAPYERQLAYAQADWMLEYVAQRFGHDKIVAMLNRFADGVDDVTAFREVLGVSGDEFMSGFRQWAAAEVEAWGLGRPQASERLQEVLAKGGAGADDAELQTLLKEHPGHPDLLRLIAERALQSADSAPQAAERAVLRYAAARPVDPWPHRALADLALRRGDLDAAVPSLQMLDLQDNENAAWAHELAKVHRRAGRLDLAADAIDRALLREPYNANFRTLAATIDLQRGDADGALHQLHALAILEPQRSEHHVRLAALYRRLGREDEARAEAAKARELDPDAAQ